MRVRLVVHVVVHVVAARGGMPCVVMVVVLARGVVVERVVVVIVWRAIRRLHLGKLTLLGWQLLGLLLLLG